jgi:hypothetical protein
MGAVDDHNRSGVVAHLFVLKKKRGNGRINQKGNKITHGAVVRDETRKTKKNENERPNPPKNEKVGDDEKIYIFALY